MKIVFWMLMTVSGVPTWVPSPIPLYSMQECVELRKKHKQNLLNADAPTACVVEGIDPNTAKESK